MMISVTGEYALKAMIYLSKHAEAWPIPGSRIAESAGIPRKYLSTILTDLVRSGLLEGTRGKSGGFQLTRSARDIRLSEVVAPFVPVHANRVTCPFGDAVCSDRDPCSFHERWKEVNAALTRFLEGTTLQEVATKRSEAGISTERRGSAR